MDLVVPGGVARDLPSDMTAQLLEQCDTLEREVQVLRDIYDDHRRSAGPLSHAWILTPQLASRLGVIGFAGRASNQPWDARVHPGPRAPTTGSR